MTFQAKLNAAFTRPIMLDPMAAEGVRNGAGFAVRSRAEVSATPSYTKRGNVAVVDISGPLSQRSWSCFGMFGDGYDAIQTRFSAAIVDPEVASVVLRIDSPGGEVSGCFEAMRSMRAAGRQSGKLVIAYADEMACSAAYAMACVASKIVVPDTGMVGSIGVIQVLAERSEQLAQDGVHVTVIKSGDAKADGHPAIPLTDDAMGRLQAEVNHLADVFADEVAESRGLTRESVLGYQAGVFYGDKAVTAGLADQVGSFADAMALASRAKRPSGVRRMESILVALGLAADAGESAGAATAKSLRGDVAALVGATESTTVDAAVGKISGWRIAASKTESLSAELEAIKTALATSERTKLVDEAIRAGKIPPANRAQFDALSTESLKACLSVLPTLVRSSSVASLAPVDAQESSLSEEEIAMCERAGITPQAMIDRKKARSKLQRITG